MIEIKRLGHPVATFTAEVEFEVEFDYQGAETDLGVDEDVDITDVWLIINNIRYQLNEVTKNAVNLHLIDTGDLFEAIHADMAEYRGSDYGRD